MQTAEETVLLFQIAKHIFFERVVEVFWRFILSSSKCFVYRHNDARTHILLSPIETLLPELERPELSSCKTF